MTTPAAITRLTEHAARAKSLMVATDKTAEVAGPILDNYEATLTRFKAGLSQVKENEKALAAVLQGMGNAGNIIDSAFQDAKPAAAQASVNGEQQVIKPTDVGKVEDIVAVHPMPPGSP